MQEREYLQQNTAMLPLALLAVSLFFVAIAFGAAPIRTPEGAENQEAALSSAPSVSRQPRKSPAPVKGAAAKLAAGAATSDHPAQAVMGYDRSIVETMAGMSLNLDHIGLWIDEYPDSALRYLRYMPAATQQNVAAIATYIHGSNAKIDLRTVWREAAALVHYSRKYGVPMALVTAVAHTESTFNPGAVSGAGAKGVMQVMWSIHGDLLSSNGISHADSSDPEKSIAAGCLLLARYIKAYGSVGSALDRYLGAFSNSYRNKIDTKVATLAGAGVK